MLTALALFSISLLSGCGVEHDGRTVPDWIVGTWRLMNFKGVNMERYGMRLVFTKSSFEYHYPDYDGWGKVTMNKYTPMYAGNEYSLKVKSANCPGDWEIESNTGATDTGYMSSSDGIWLSRISTTYPYYWFYKREDQ